MKRFWYPLLLLAVPFAFFASNLQPGTVMLPLDILSNSAPFSEAVPEPLRKVHNPHLSDMVTIYYPWTEFFRQERKFPLWNPYSFCGSPLIANAQNGILFPLTWFYLVLPAGVSSILIAILKMAASGLFTFLFFRETGFTRPACLIGGTCYMLSGHMIVWFGYPTSFPLAILPFLFWSLERLLLSPHVIALAHTSLAFGLLFVGGQPQTGFLVGLAGLIYFFIRVQSVGHARLPLMIRFAIAALIGFCLASPQILPFLEYLQLSAAGHLRGHLGWKQYPWFTLISWVLPRFFGDFREGNFWGFSSFLGESIYIGAIPLVFATTGAFLGRRNRVFWGTLGIFLFGCCGLYLPLLERLYLAWPLLSNIDNNKLLVLVTWGLVSFAVMGIDQFFSSSGNDKGGLLGAWWSAALGWVLVASAVILYFKDAIVTLNLAVFEVHECKYLLIVLIIGLVLLHLWRHGIIPVWTTVVLLFLATLVDIFRVFYYYCPSYPVSYLTPSSSPSVEFVRSSLGEHRFLGLEGYLPPETSILFRLQDARGYDGLTPYAYYKLLGKIDPHIHNLKEKLATFAPQSSVWTQSTLFYRSLERHLKSADRETQAALSVLDYWSPDITCLERPGLLSIMGIRYILGPKNNQVPARAGYRLIHVSDAAVWENSTVLPKAFVSTNPHFVARDDEALETISDPKFEFDKTAVVTVSEHPSVMQAQERGSGILIPAKIDRYTPDTVDISADSPEGGWLILSDLNFPGWEATADGLPAAIHAGNYLFRAVQLPPGRHNVRFVYRPWSFFLGQLLCALALLAIAVAVAVTIIRRRTGKRDPVEQSG